MSTLLPVAVTAALETALNQYLRMDPEAVGRLAALEGKVIALDLRGLDATLYLIPGPDGLRVLNHYAGEADAHLRGTPLAFARLGLAADSSDLLFTGEVQITGDVELGQRFKRILDRMHIDWEEHLASVFGDVAAHRLMHTLNQATAWGRESVATLGRDVAEYLQDEIREAAHPERVQRFLDEVDTLRADADRLELRVARLHQRLAAREAGENNKQ